MTVYYGNWSGKEDIVRDFNIDLSELDGAKILLADYRYEDYSGSAFVLFEKDGKLYEDHGSHCSCYGLEDQWSPEETSAEELLYRLEKGECYYFHYDMRDVLTEYLKVKLKRKIKRK